MDHVCRTLLMQGMSGSGTGLYGEERLLVALHDALVRGRLAAAALPFGAVDIICAVPEGAIDWAIRQLGQPGFAGWDETNRMAAAAYERDHTPFKASFRATTGVEVDRVLRTLRESGRTGESPQLKALLSTLVDHLGNSGPDPDAGLIVLNPYRGS